MTEEIKVKMNEYGVKAVPTTIIDATLRLWEFLIFHGYAEKICIRN
jgi:hypothetical protein